MSAHSLTKHAALPYARSFYSFYYTVNITAFSNYISIHGYSMHFDLLEIPIYLDRNMDKSRVSHGPFAQRNATGFRLCRRES